MKRIMLATDGSDSALKAARYLRSLAAADDSMQVLVVNVMPVPQPLALAGLTGAAYVPDVPVDAMVENAAKPVLDATLAALSLPPDRVATEVLVGSPPEELCRLAKAEGVYMMVLGNRGLNPIKEFLLGSVSDRCLHLAPCPVLVVK